MRRLIATFTAAAAVALMAGCGLQPRASTTGGPAGPSPRANAALAYDAAHGTLVLFGGGAATWFGDTWTWDGRSWHQQFPPTSPSPRGAAAMSFDPTSGRVVLFGGIGDLDRSRETRRTDMWSWDGATWTQLRPAAVPPATFGRALMAFDPVSQHLILLIDSELGNIPRDQTWEWTGTSWQMIDANGPIGDGPGGLSQNPPAGLDSRPRVGAMLAPSTALGLDPVRNRLMAVQRVQYGDAPVHGVVTWEWSGHDWVVVEASSRAFAAAQDFLGDPVLASEPGGRSVVLVDLHGTWSWDGTEWTAGLAAPQTGAGAALALDRSAGHDLLFGGISAGDLGGLYGDTWTWTGSGWHQVAGPKGPRMVPFPSVPPPIGGLTQSQAIAIARHTLGHDSAPVIQARLARAGAFGNPYPTAATWEWGVSLRVDQAMIGHGPIGSGTGRYQVHSVAAFIDYLSGEVLEQSWPAPKILGGEGG